MENIEDLLRELIITESHTDEESSFISMPSDSPGEAVEQPERDASDRKAAFVASLSELDNLLRELKSAKNAMEDKLLADPTNRLAQTRTEVDEMLVSLSQLEVDKRLEAIDWERDNSRLFTKSNEIEELMASLSDLENLQRNALIRIGDDRASDGSREHSLSDPNEPFDREEVVRCTTCEELLQPGSVFEVDGKIYCKRDLNNVPKSNCTACSLPILSRMISIFGQNWHPEHFICSICGCDFDADGFHLSLDGSNKVYCRRCFIKSVAPKCNRCHNVIADSYIVALKCYWHPECFSCSVCNSNFDSGYFYELDSKPYCEKHYYQEKGLICYKCKEYISGRCINALSRKYHPDHFSCSFCAARLSRDTFREAFDSPYCIDCHFRLFGY